MTIKLKTVLLVITKGNDGGAQKYVYDLATNLDRSEFRVMVAVGETGVLVDKLKNAGISVYLLPDLSNSLSLKKNWQAGLELRRLVKSIQPDIIHLNSSVAGVIGTIVGRLTRTPKIIFTAHGFAFNEDRPFWQKLCFRYLYWQTMVLSTWSILVATPLIKQVSTLGIKHKLKVIRPGRNLGAVFSREEARATLTNFYPVLAPYQTDTWLVCLAELHPIKGHRYLLEAFRELAPTFPRARLCLIGAGQEAERLADTVEEYSLSNQVLLLGHLTEAARFLKAFDILILPSISEAHPYVLLEAGLSGLPVIATDVGGVTDIVTNQKTGLLVPPRDPTDLQKALATLLTDTSLAKTYGTSLKESLSARTVESMVSQTAALYRR